MHWIGTHKDQYDAVSTSMSGGISRVLPSLHTLYPIFRYPFTHSIRYPPTSLRSVSGPHSFLQLSIFSLISLSFLKISFASKNSFFSPTSRAMQPIHLHCVSISLKPPLDSKSFNPACTFYINWLQILIKNHPFFVTIYRACTCESFLKKIFPKLNLFVPAGEGVDPGEGDQLSVRGEWLHLRSHWHHFNGTCHSLASLSLTSLRTLAGEFQWGGSLWGPKINSVYKSDITLGPESEILSLWQNVLTSPPPSDFLLQVTINPKVTQYYPQEEVSCPTSVLVICVFQNCEQPLPFHILHTLLDATAIRLFLSLVAF